MRKKSLPISRVVKSVCQNHEKNAAFGKDCRVKKCSRKKNDHTKLILFENLKNLRANKIKLGKIFKTLLAKLDHSIPNSS